MRALTTELKRLRLRRITARALAELMGQGKGAINGRIAGRKHGRQPSTGLGTDDGRQASGRYRRSGHGVRQIIERYNIARHVARLKSVKCELKVGSDYHRLPERIRARASIRSVQAKRRGSVI